VGNIKKSFKTYSDLGSLLHLNVQPLMRALSGFVYGFIFELCTRRLWKSI